MVLGIEFILNYPQVDRDCQVGCDAMDVADRQQVENAESLGHRGQPGAQCGMASDWCNLAPRQDGKAFRRNFLS